MTREELQHAITKLNESIAHLQARLHPPPFNPGDRNELEAELVAAEGSRDALEQMLSNLPRSEPVAPLTMSAAVAQKTIDRHRKSEITAAIRLSKATRMYSDALVAMMTPAASKKARRAG